MSAYKSFGIATSLVLAGVLTVPPVASALESQEYVNIQSQCRQEAQDYDVAPEQIEEYVSACVLAYGGMPEAAPEAAPEETPEATADVPAPAADDGADAPAVMEQYTDTVVE
jgi:hypothetical protein